MGYAACNRTSLWLLLWGLSAVVANGEAEGKWSNRLGLESSQYLRQHADNPVDWYPWGSEALQRARHQDKPIFLSVGYSTCYWCHVMERRVFSDPEIAELMNRHFVNIKVDREERPDLDEIYMVTTQLITGHGGWPNSVFLTPDLEPFFAGTYFPPADTAGRPGFPRLLETLSRAWVTERQAIEAQAERYAEATRQALSPAAPPLQEGLPTTAARRAVADLKTRFDPEWGGFGEAPKFPSPGGLRLLWNRARHGDVQAEAMVVETLEAMGRGAIYDQLDGGFHRYTLDRAWRLPHFEKMLYDNALLAELLVEVATARQNDDLTRLARGTLEFMLRYLQLPEGGFRSSIDAETDGVEGAFYLWERAALERVLGEHVQFVAPILGFDGAPNFESRAYTLFLTAPLARHAERLGLSRAVLLGRLTPLLSRLSRERALRAFPRVDDKTLTDWNGMAIAALAVAGRAYGDRRYTAAAIASAELLLGPVGDRAPLRHVRDPQRPGPPAFLDDYAFLVHGLVELWRATEDRRWLDEAERLVAEMERQLREPSGRYFTGPDDPTLLVRASSALGGAIPSGNGQAIVNLLDLAALTGRPIYRARALSALQSLAPDLQESPGSMPTVARALWMMDGQARESDLSASTPPDPLTLVAADLQLLESATETGWQRFSLQLTIRDGWHLNANPASLDLLVPTEIGGELRSVVYPPGSTLRPAFAGETLQVYRDSMEIVGDLRASQPGLWLTYQACDDRRCLPPVTRQVVPAADSR